MSTRNWDFQRRNNLRITTKTANATLTKQEVMHGLVIMYKSSGLVLTLPAASMAYNGARVTFVNKYGAAKVTVTLGFGGAGGSYDYITLAQGDAYVCVCDGSCWYDCGHTTAGAS